jgi:hypothetical protein
MAALLVCNVLETTISILDFKMLFFDMDCKCQILAERVRCTTTLAWHWIGQIKSEVGGGLSFDESVTAALKDYNLNYDTLVKEWRASVDKEMMGR